MDADCFGWEERDARGGNNEDGADSSFAGGLFLSRLPSQIAASLSLLPPRTAAAASGTSPSYATPPGFLTRSLLGVAVGAAATTVVVFGTTPPPATSAPSIKTPAAVTVSLITLSRRLEPPRLTLAMPSVGDEALLSTDVHFFVAGSPAIPSAGDSGHGPSGSDKGPGPRLGDGAQGPDAASGGTACACAGDAEGLHGKEKLVPGASPLKRTTLGGPMDRLSALAEGGTTAVTVAASAALAAGERRWAGDVARVGTLSCASTAAPATPAAPAVPAGGSGRGGGDTIETGLRERESVPATEANLPGGMAGPGLPPLVASSATTVDTGAAVTITLLGEGSQEDARRRIPTLPRS